jgi:hypothetical protein
VEVDPGELRLPMSRTSGADPAKLNAQIAKHGDDLNAMPYIEVTLGSGGEMMINDGVTRASRAAKLRPGVTITVVVIEERAAISFRRLPKVKERI